MSHRWEKEDKYIEVEYVHSVDCGPGIYVSSNAFDDGQIPDEWKDVVPDSKPEQQQKLISSVRDWVKLNGFS